MDISIKRTLKIGHCLCRFCAIQQRKKAVAISLPQLFGGSWWIRKPRSKKQSAGLFFAVCGRPTCSNPTSSSTKKNPQPKLRVLFGGSWWIRTTEALSSRFTVCPHWPLGKAPIFFLFRRGTPCRSVLDYYSKAEPEMQAFFSIFLRFFQKSFLFTLHRAIFKKKERPAGVRRGAPRGISEDRRRIMYICNGIVALLVVWPGPSDCSGMAQGTVCMIAGCFPRLSFDYDT